MDKSLSSSKYNVVMFAYNEAGNIENSITSVFNNTDEELGVFHIIANGCTDNTVEVVSKVKSALKFDKLQLTEIALGDKCNAWNEYIQRIAEYADTHFFVDADVNFSSNSFKILHSKLAESTIETEAIAGMPLSGRNIDYYRSLVVERSCFFGNLYGLKHSFIDRCRTQHFRLPVGLNWIDSFLTKAVNTELTFDGVDRKNKVTYVSDVGYYFDSISPFVVSDLKLYINRIARYELGKLQEIKLDAINVEQWPSDLVSINQELDREFSVLTSHLSFVKRFLVRRRLTKLLLKSKPSPNLSRQQ